MCNSFLKIFGIPEDASMEQLEEVYWKIIESCDEKVLVRYGSDVDTGRSGSGFESDGKYGKSPWNVNNFPFSSLSLLKHLGRKISGVMRPWLCNIEVHIPFSNFAI
jgi:histone demethylase JARID1